MHVLKLSSYVLSVSLLALAPVKSAKAQRHGNHHQTGTQYGQTYSQDKVETVFANTYLSGSDKINLTRLINLAPGETLKKVKVTASSSSYGAKLVMKVNNQRVDAAAVDYYMSDKTLQMPLMSSPADKVIITANQGSVYVGKIEATIAQSYYDDDNGADVLKARINEVVRGHSVIKVLQEVNAQNQDRLRGLEVKKVILKAEALGRGHRAASAQLIVNGMPVGVPELITSGKIAFKLSPYGPQTIGREIKQLQIAVTGRVEVKMVGIKVKDQMPNYPQVLRSQMRKVVYGSERLELSELLGPQQVPMGAKVQNVTIVAEGNGKIIMTGAGMVMGDMDFSYYTRSQTVQAPMGTPLASIKMRARGPLTIKSVEVTLTY